MFEKVKNISAHHRHFILYVIIGCSGALLDVALFFVLFNWVGVDKMLATVMSTFAGMTNNFMWNSRVNFKVTTSWGRRLIQFYAVGMVGIVLTLALFAIFTDLLGVNANIVKVGSLVIVLIVQYTLNKFWTFR